MMDPSLVFTGPAVMMGEGMAHPLPLQMLGVYIETEKSVQTDLMQVLRSDFCFDLFINVIYSLLIVAT